MAENKTQKTDVSIDVFIDSLENDRRRDDSRRLASLMERITGEKPRMWGPSIVGFGDARLIYDSGREVDWFKVGFSPRKVYVMAPSERRSEYLGRLGMHKTGKGCIYINKLDDVDMGVLEELVGDSVRSVETDGES